MPQRYNHRPAYSFDCIHPAAGTEYTRAGHPQRPPPEADPTQAPKKRALPRLEQGGPSPVAGQENVLMPWPTPQRLDHNKARYASDICSPCVVPRPLRPRCAHHAPLSQLGVAGAGSNERVQQQRECWLGAPVC